MEASEETPRQKRADLALLGATLVDVACSAEVEMVVVVLKVGPAVLYRASEDGERVRRVGHQCDITYDQEPRPHVSGLRLDKITPPPADPSRA